MADHRIGVDIGGTRTKLVLLGPSGTIVERRAMSSRHDSAGELIAAIVAALRGWVDDAARVRGIGVAIPGVLEPTTRKVMSAPNLTIIEGVSMGAALADEFGVPVGVDNDANAAGLAEARYGAAKGCDVAACLTVGTGLGGAILLGGRLFRGAEGMAGEVGQLMLHDAGRRLEEEVGAAAVAAGYRERGGELPYDDAAEVAARAAAGDAAARGALAACGECLGIGIAALVNLLNPQRVVVGGGVAGAGEWLLQPARRVAAERAWAPLWRQCDVVAAQLGADAGAVGAALLVAPED